MSAIHAGWTCPTARAVAGHPAQEPTSTAPPAARATATPVTGQCRADSRAWSGISADAIRRRLPRTARRRRRPVRFPTAFGRAFPLRVVARPWRPLNGPYAAASGSRSRSSASRTFAFALAITTVSTYLPVLASSFASSTVVIGALAGNDYRAMWLVCAAAILVSIPFTRRLRDDDQAEAA